MKTNTSTANHHTNLEIPYSSTTNTNCTDRLPILSQHKHPNNCTDTLTAQNPQQLHQYSHSTKTPTTAPDRDVKGPYYDN